MISKIKNIRAHSIPFENLMLTTSFIPSFLAPLNITQSLSDINVLLGQSGTLQITCDAFPTPKVTWYA